MLVAVWFARAPDAADVGPAAASRQIQSAPLVRVVRPERASTVLRVVATGSVAVRNHVALTPLVGGRVVSVAPGLRAGGSFQAGERLLTIDPRDFELALERARASIASAQANLELQEAQSDAATANYALLHPGERVPALVAKAPQIAQAKAQLAAAQAELALAVLELERTVFALPFAGRVAASTAEVGQLLARGQSFGRAYALDAVQVVVPLAADELARIAPAVGRRATVRISASEAGDSALAARVERRSAQLDERTRFATLHLAFADSGQAPLPGTFVDVDIGGPAVADTFVLPEAAEQAGGVVWAVAAGALTAVRPRTVARLPEGWVVDAFDPRDGIVVGAVPGGREGLAVTAQPTPNPAPAASPARDG